MKLWTARYEVYLKKFLYNLGFSIGTHPVKYLVSLLLTTAVCSLGFLRFHSINNPRITFTDSDSLSHIEGEKIGEFLGTNGSAYFIEVLISASDNRSLLRTEQLKEVRQFLYDSRFVVQTRENEELITYLDLCEPYCEKNTPLLKLLDVFYKNFPVPRTYPVFNVGDHELFIGSDVFDVTLKPNSTEIEDFRKVAAHFVLSHRDLKILHRWEDDLIRIISSDKYPNLRIGASSDKLIAAEVKAMGDKTAPNLTIALGELIGFLIICAFRYDRRESKPLESLLGGSIPVLVGITTVGLVCATGYAFQSIVVSVLFLILAIGIDDVFLMLGAWHRTDKTLPIPERVAGMVQESGCSMTVTSLTNLVSFGNGVLSSTSVLQCFAIYASVASVVCFIYQLILFPCIIALTASNEYRDISKSRLPPTIPVVRTLGKFKEGVFRSISFAAVKTWVAVVTLMVLIVYWGVALYGVTLLETELAIQHLAPPTSSIVKMRLEYDETVKQMQTVIVLVKRPGDLRKPEVREQLDQLVRLFETTSHAFGPESTFYWLRAYMKDETNFTYTDMDGFISDEEYWKGSLKLNETACELDEPECVHEFIFTTGFKDLVKYSDVYKQMLKWRSIVAAFPQFEAYPYTARSDFAEQSAALESVIWQTILSEVLCMGLSFLVFIPDLASICAAMFALFSVNLGVLGFLPLWGVGIDPFSLASLLMSIGFSVDICAHISYHYYQHKAGNPRVRIEETLQHIGWPTTQGAISTVLAILPVVFHPTYLFHVFLKTIVLVNLFGVIHGLFVLPVVLSVLSKLGGKSELDAVKENHVLSLPIKVPIDKKENL